MGIISRLCRNFRIKMPVVFQAAQYCTVWTPFLLARTVQEHPLSIAAFYQPGVDDGTGDGADYDIAPFLCFSGSLHYLYRHETQSPVSQKKMAE